MLAIDGHLRRAEGAWHFQVSLVDKGVTAVMGPSGSGKTTLLRVIAGLEPAFAGTIAWRGQVLHGNGQPLPPHRRRFAWVPQQAPLMPNLTVGQHLELVPERPEGQLRERVLDGLDLGGLLSRRVDSLSGGQRQRVALAQAILSAPQLLLLDEPLANIDWLGRRRILGFLRTLELPMVYVSHGLEEVLSLANRVVVMGERRVQSVLSVDELMCDPGRWGLPADALCSILEARVEERDASVGLIRVSCQGQDLWLPDGGQARGQTMLLKIDSRDVSLTLEEPGATSILNILPCVVVDGFEISPAHMGVRLQSGQLSFYALVTKRSWERLHLAKGLSLFAQLKAAVLV